jgi:predicted DNA-binding transcriptional regulator AlpA
MGEILTAKEVAAMLKISPRQVYELAKQSENPIPCFAVSGLTATKRMSVRFRRVDVDGWIAGLVAKPTRV